MCRKLFYVVENNFCAWKTSFVIENLAQLAHFVDKMWSKSDRYLYRTTEIDRHRYIYKLLNNSPNKIRRVWGMTLRICNGNCGTVFTQSQNKHIKHAPNYQAHQNLVGKLALTTRRAPKMQIWAGNSVNIVADTYIQEWSRIWMDRQHYYSQKSDALAMDENIW